MALPVTITGISTAVAPVGPFKSANSAAVAIAKGGTANTNLGDVSTALRIGQTWTHDGSPVSSIIVHIWKVGAPVDTVTASIYATSAGLPVGAALYTSTNTISGATLGTVSGTQPTSVFSFSGVTTLAASTMYAVVLSRSSAVDAVNYYRWGGDAISTYAGGTQVRYNGTIYSTTSGVDRDTTVVGPVGAYFVFGCDGTTATTLQAYKSTAPDTSWTSIATKTGFVTGIQYISAYQVGDVIHMVVTDGATTSINHKYQTFDCSTEMFVTAETINSALNTQTSTSANAYGTAIVVRSNGRPVVHYQAARISTFAQTAYRERTGVATWAAGVAVSTTGVNSINPFVVLGALDRLHFLWFNSTNTIQRHLTSANVLGTAASTGATTAVQDVCTFDDAGTIRHVGFTAAQSIRWASADNPTVTAASVTFGTPVRTADDPFNDNVYALYQSSTDSDLYTKLSTDKGATFGTAASSFVGTVAAADANLSKNQLIYQRGNDFVFPYIVNDNGTLKYNEAVVRAGVTNYTMPATTGAFALTGIDATLTKTAAAVSYTLPADKGAYVLTGQVAGLELARAAARGSIVLTGLPTILRSARKLAAAQGAVTLTGIDATLTRSTAVIHYTMPATVGAFALSGKDAALTRLANKTLAVTAGSYVLSGTGVGLRASRILSGATGSYVLAGAPAALVGRRKAAAAMGHYALSGTATGFLPSRRLVAEASSYVLTGADATLKRITGQFVSAQTGVYALTGTAVSLRRTYRVAADVGSYALTGTAATLLHSSEPIEIEIGGGLRHRWLTARDGYADGAVIVVNVDLVAGRAMGTARAGEQSIVIGLRCVDGVVAGDATAGGAMRLSGISLLAGRAHGEINISEDEALPILAEAA